MRVAIELDSRAVVRGKQCAWLLSVHEVEQTLPLAARRRIDIPAVYLASLKDGTARFITALCQVDFIRHLLADHVKRVKPGYVGRSGLHPMQPHAPLGDAAVELPVDWGLVARSIARRDLATARRYLAERTDRTRDQAQSAASLAKTRRHASSARSRSAVQAVPKAGRLPAALGIIDFGCAFAHPHFRAALGGATRVRRLWDQGRAPQWCGDPGVDDVWRGCSDFGYGRETDGGRLDRLIRRAPAELALWSGAEAGGPAVEQWTYARAGLPELLDASCHGTQVMDVAAGSGFRLDGEPDQVDEDAASSADIIFVQLPGQAVGDLSGAWLVTHVIDAIEYILRQARADDAGRPVVINLSYGNFAGSHDGKSMLEVALDHYSKLAGVVIVIAAGNMPGPERPVHACAELAPGQQVTLDWITQARDPTQSFLEVWLEGACADVHFILQAPDGPSIQLDAAHPAWLLAVGNTSPSQTVAGAVFVPASTAGGPDGMLLLASAPTDVGRTGGTWLAPAVAGVWQVQVLNKGLDSVRLAAWCERDEPGNAADPVSSQSWLRAARRPGDQAAVRHPSTFTALACGRETITVGACMVKDGRAALVCAFSGHGTDRLDPSRHVPTICAPGERVVGRELRGLRVAGCVSGAESEVRGTSAAAAWVSRFAMQVAGKRRAGFGRRAVLRALLDLAPGPVPGVACGFGAVLGRTSSDAGAGLARLGFTFQDSVPSG